MLSALRSRLFGHTGLVAEEASEVLEGALESEESVEYLLPGAGTLVHEDDGREEMTGVADLTLAAATDRRLLFVAIPGGDGPADASDATVLDVPYTDVKRVDAEGRFLRPTLVVEGWIAGTYRFRTVGGAPLGDTVTYVRRASAGFQRVIAALGDAREQAAAMYEHLEAGRETEVREAEQVAMGKLDLAREWHARLDDEAVAETLENSIEAAEGELYWKSVEGRLARVDALAERVPEQTAAGAYTDAYRSYQRAREHLEKAMVLEIEYDFGRASEIQSKIEQIDLRLDHLRVRPLALAKQAQERALGTETPEVEVRAWQEAFEHYSDALLAGWGTDLEFAGETDALRFQVEWVVSNLVEAHQERARQLADEAEACHTRGDLDGADERYDEADEHLAAAERLASEYRSPDSDAVREHRARLDERHEKIVVD